MSPQIVSQMIFQTASDTDDDQRLVRILRSGAAQLGVVLEEPTSTKLIKYLRLLAKWNNIYNLTAVRTLDAMIIRHLLDSLAVFPYLVGTSVVDVGTGAGLPGVPLAVASPERAFLLLDSRAKRTRFLTHVVGELGLVNVWVERMRVEEYRPAMCFETVISRAFSRIADFIHLAGHLCAESGRVLAMKGRLPSAELDSIPAGWQVEEVHPLSVPGLDEERHLVILRRQPSLE